MAQHINTNAGAPPYKNLFSSVSIAPPNTSLAYISTQWAADPNTGELAEGTAGDYAKQSRIIWANIVNILKELGAEMKDIVHKTAYFLDFNDEIGEQVVMAQVSQIPDEWKPDMFKAALSFNGPARFHRPGIVTAWDLVVAVPNK